MGTTGLTSIFKAFSQPRKSVDFTFNNDDVDRQSETGLLHPTNSNGGPRSLEMAAACIPARSGLLQRASSGGGIPRPTAASEAARGDMKKMLTQQQHHQHHRQLGETLLPHVMSELVVPPGRKMGSGDASRVECGSGSGGASSASGEPVGKKGSQQQQQAVLKSHGAGGSSASLTAAEWRKLAILAFGSLVNNCTYSLLAPFFPTVAKERGVSDMHIGLIFGIFSLAAFFTAPLAGILLQRKRFARRNMMVFGMLVNATFTAAFGLLEFFKRDEVVLEPDEGDGEDVGPLLVGYVSFAFATRILVGIGCGLTDTALYALIASMFIGHEQLPALMGTMESVCGLGFLAGPALGSLLYDATSFSTTLFLPSALLGVYVLLPILVLHEPAKPHHQRTSSSDNSCIESGGIPATNAGGSSNNTGRGTGGGGEVKMYHLFRTFRFVSVCWSGVLANVQFGYLEATYAEHAEAPGSSTRVGFLFAIMAFTYCLLTSPVGSICTRLGLHTCLALGFVIESIGYVVLVPPDSWGREFVELPGREHVAMAINGLGAAFSYVPIYPALLKASGGEDNAFEGLTDLVAGVTGSSFQLGNFLGPVCAGLVVSVTSTYHQAIVFVVVIFLTQAFVEARGVLFPFIKW